MLNSRSAGFSFSPKELKEIIESRLSPFLSFSFEVRSPQHLSCIFLSRTTSFLCPVVDRCASAKISTTLGRRFGNVVGSAGSSGMKTFPPVVEGGTEDLRVEATEEARVPARAGMVIRRDGGALWLVGLTRFLRGRNHAGVLREDRASMTLKYSIKISASGSQADWHWG